MPVKRRNERVRRADLETLNKEQERQLLTGSTFFSWTRMDRETFEAAWEIHGERILAEFIEAHPGYRPFAWWLLVHGKERPIVQEWPGWDRETWLAEQPWKFGFLDTCLLGGPDFSYFQQPEFDYLQEHDLLLPGELERYQALHPQT